jgi:hypothetical protein
MLNTKDLWAEQTIAQERYQVIARTRAAERARARSRQRQTTLRSRALSRVGQLWQRLAHSHQPAMMRSMSRPHERAHSRHKR